MHLNAAGIDGGSAEHQVAVPLDRSPAPGRRLARFTAELQAVADGRQAGRLETVVMESPGGAWIALFQILEARGCAVHLVQARHAQSRPGRTTDIADGPWRQQLQTCGLLTSALRPTAALGVWRSD